MRGQSDRIAARVRGLFDDEADSGSLDPPGPGPYPPVGSGSFSPDSDDLLPVVHRPTLWQRLAARVPVRVDPGRRAAVAVGVAVLVVAMATGAWVLANRPQAVAVSSTPTVPGAVSPVGTDQPLPRPTTPTKLTKPTSAAATPTGTAAGSAAASPLVVDVAGKVRHPGVYRLPPGSRVNDAIEAAGGARDGVDLSTLNLAAKIADGQQIAVGVTGADESVPAAAATATAAPSGAGADRPVDLNTAALSQLEALPGVGPVLAQHILDWRAAHGRFSSIDQLKDVSGIGPATFAVLEPLVSCG